MMKNIITKLVVSILLSSALYVFLMSKDGFDSAYWLAVSLYIFVWGIILLMPVMLVLKKRKQLKVIPLAILGGLSAAISISIPHFKDVYLAKTSSLTLRQGQNVLFENGIISEYSLSQFYDGLLYSIICGVIGGIILGVLLKKNDTV